MFTSGGLGHGLKNLVLFTSLGVGLLGVKYGEVCNDGADFHCD